MNESMNREEIITQIATAFSTALHETFRSEEMVDIVRQNRIYRKEMNGFCATHDYGDPESIMILALHKNNYPHLDIGDVQAGRCTREAVAIYNDLFNTAWTQAKDNEFRC